MQPPGAPKEQWEERKDRALRQLIEDVKALRIAQEKLLKQVAELEAKVTQADVDIEQKLDRSLRGHVGWPAFVSILTGFLGLVFLVSTAVTAPTKEALATAKQEAKEKAREDKDQLKDLRLELEQLKAKAKTDAETPRRKPR